MESSIANISTDGGSGALGYAVDKSAAAVDLASWRSSFGPNHAHQTRRRRRAWRSRSDAKTISLEVLSGLA